jgi:LysM repeat protein
MAKRSRRALGITLMFVCSALTACTELSSGPAPVLMNGRAAAPTNSSAAKANPPDARFVTVRAGQSLGGIAETNHVSKQAIIAANHLSPPYKLKIGLRLAIPAAVAESAAKRGKAATAAPTRSRQSTVTADNRSPARAKRATSGEIIPLDDPASPSTAATPVTSSADRTTWVSPQPTTASRLGTTGPEVAKEPAASRVN